MRASASPFFDQRPSEVRAAAFDFDFGERSEDLRLEPQSFQLANDDASPVQKRPGFFGVAQFQERDEAGTMSDQLSALLADRHGQRHARVEPSTLRTIGRAGVEPVERQSIEPSNLARVEPSPASSPSSIARVERPADRAQEPRPRRAPG